MLVLAISARALRILDVSVAALAPVPFFLSWLFSEMKSLGGVPIGVVDPESTDNEIYQKPFSTKFFFLISEAVSYDWDSYHSNFGLSAFA